MRDNRGIDRDLGNTQRTIADLQRQIDALRSERRAGATAISEGDFVVSGGGSIRVQDGGAVVCADANSVVSLTDGGLFLSTLAGGLSIVPRVSVFPDKLSFDNGPGVLNTVGASAPGDGFLYGTQWRISHPTTASAANAVLDAFTNVLARSTSSRRYKQDEQAAEVAPAAVLKMVGKTWRDRAEVEADPDTEKRYVGFIAEDLHDLGLTEFVTYDEEGRPDAIAYDRLSVALLALAKDQQTRLDDIEARLDRLEN